MVRQLEETDHDLLNNLIDRLDMAESDEVIFIGQYADYLLGEREDYKHKTLLFNPDFFGDFGADSLIEEQRAAHANITKTLLNADIPTIINGDGEDIKFVVFDLGGSRVHVGTAFSVVSDEETFKIIKDADYVTGDAILLMELFGTSAVMMNLKGEIQGYFYTKYSVLEV